MIVSMNSGDIDEEDISVTYFRQGVPEAFKVFFFQYYPELFSFAYLMVHDAPAAYQLGIDAFFLCWERRTDFNSDQDIKSFVYLATRNYCLDHLRRVANPAIADKQVPASPPPDTIPPYIMRDIYAFASVGLKRHK